MSKNEILYGGERRNGIVKYYRDGVGSGATYEYTYTPRDDGSPGCGETHTIEMGGGTFYEKTILIIHGTIEWTEFKKFISEIQLMGE